MNFAKSDMTPMGYGIPVVNSLITHVFPAEGRFAALAVDVGDSVKTGQQHSLFRLTATDVYADDKQQYRRITACPSIPQITENHSKIMAVTTHKCPNPNPLPHPHPLISQNALTAIPLTSTLSLPTVATEPDRPANVCFADI